MISISAFYIVTGLFDWLWCVSMVFNVILLLFVNHLKDFFCDLQTAWRLVLSLKPWSYIWLEFGLFSTNIYIYISVYPYLRRIGISTTRGPVSLTWVNIINSITSILKCEITLLIHFQTSSVFQFLNGYLISSQTSRGVWLLIHAGIKVDPCNYQV